MSSSLPPLRSAYDLERVLEFEFVRATENAALQAIHWLGRGEKELADGAACSAIYGVFDILDVRGEVVIGEGIKDNAPGIFVGEHLGTWRDGSPRFNIALDPIDGTSNIAKGLPNSISVIAAAQIPDGAPCAMKSIPSFYSHKIAYGPAVKKALEGRGDRCFLDMPLQEVITFVAEALGKRERDLVVSTMDRPRHQDIVEQIRRSGAALRMVTDGDIAAAVAPSMPESTCDLYVGIGGSPEGILAAAALKCLGGDMQLRMWFHDEAHRAEVAAQTSVAEMNQVFRVHELIVGESALFCATGISDSPLLPGCRLVGHRVETHSILMRSRSGTVRRIHAVHDLDRKVVPLRA
ncbi:fructose-bisphosphatase class II family protein [Prosthecobacter sp.]|uniref:fructose-bisphosphatase class II family protein n=1 Tax=Prosthecobacter sp. TaxID=1965333 RepID=UPI001D6C0598|nr:fructose-bisphosphatase class II family protein [Prosthecobacter sp.]MCB1276424.1 fructose-bisphosphatase class II family protein [Prosthecobacter sp.]